MAEEMGIMSQLRKRMTTILWITAILFIAYVIVQWGMNLMDRSGRQGSEQDALGEVAGQEISMSLYQRAMEQARKNTVERGEEYTDQTESQLREQTWNELVNRILLEKQFEQKEVKLGDHEIYEVLKNAPPDVVKRHDAFMTDGRFDETKFQQALINPEVDWRPVENYLRSNIPYEKLKQLVESMVFVTNSEVKQTYIRRNERVNVNYMRIAPLDLEEFEVDSSEAALEKYYEDHKDDYYEKASVILKYVSFPIEPSKFDSSEIMSKLDMIYQRLEDGEEFSDLAKQFSQDRGTAANGGELGYFSRGQMVPQFEEVAFTLEIGELSEPVKSDYGWHIIKVLDRKVENEMDMANAAHILLMLNPSTITVDSIRTMADSLYAIADSVGLDSASALTGLGEVQTTFPVAKGDNIDGIGFHTGLSHFAFAQEEGALYPVVAGQEAFYVYELAEKREEGIQPLEKVKERVKNDMIQAQRSEVAIKKMQKAYQDVKAGGDFFEVAESLEIDADTTGYFSREDFVNNVGFEPLFKGAAFGLSKDNSLSEILTGSMDVLYLVEFIDKQPVDFSAYNDARTSILQEIYRNKRTEAYNKWFRNMRENTEIVDNRYELLTQ